DYWAYVENYGLIAVQALGGASGSGLDLEGVAIGLDIGNTVAFTNHAGAQLLVEASDLAIGVYTFAQNDLGAPIVDNAGLIEARAANPDGLSIGIDIVQPGYVPNTLVNSGTIRADFAIYARNSNAALINTQEFVHNLAGGVLDGHVNLGLGDDELTNDGFINGDVILDAGNDVYSGSGGISGVTDMGFGEDRYTGGAWNDRVIGGRGNDVLTGNGGADILVGGFGDDVLAGVFGNDTLIGEWGNDTIVTIGGDYVEGNDGDDRVELGDYTFQAVHGGNGTDTLVLATDTRDLDLGEVLGSGRVTGFEIIHLNAFKRLLIDAATARDAAGKGLPLRIAGYDTDTVLLEGAWIEAGTSEVDGVTYARWANGTAEVLITPGVVVQLASGQDFGGLDAIAAGTPAAQLGAAVGIDYSSPATLLLSYVVQGEGFTVDTNEIFFSDGREVFYADTATTLTNNGLIESYTTAASAGIGIDFGGNATVINNGVIDVQQLVPQDRFHPDVCQHRHDLRRGGGIWSPDLFPGRPVRAGDLRCRRRPRMGLADQ
ncbi:calcium-binding protein, partial [Rhizorhabdus sp.]|uniref:calcium-binding protein n=1 Tax=Rhizorhabdus sp. TaxID=1968843 RepID=UPI00199A9BBB